MRSCKGFRLLQIQLASNGVKIARDEALIRRLIDAGLCTLYLHFDGISRITEPLLEIKKQAIAKLSKAQAGCCAGSYAFKRVNDHEVGGIVRFAAENVDVVRGVNFQLAFNGAASAEERKSRRFTFLIFAIDLKRKLMVRLRRAISILALCCCHFNAEVYIGEPQVELNAHPHCGVATYVFVTDRYFHSSMDSDNISSSYQQPVLFYGRLGDILGYRKVYLLVLLALSLLLVCVVFRRISSDDPSGKSYHIILVLLL
jgi:uncharacterized radical SAM superfamily Fe-S cluster-containing enzyme